MANLLDRENERFNELHRVDPTTGAVELQSGQTGYSAKLRLGHALVRLDNFARHRNPLAHRALARVARRITWASLDPDLAEHLAAHPRPGG